MGLTAKTQPFNDGPCQATHHHHHAHYLNFSHIVNEAESRDYNAISMPDNLEVLPSIPRRPRSRSLSLGLARALKLGFQHEPLNLQTASIRLVEVLPLDPSGLVQCRIRHATTEAEYTCISYVWGSPKETHLIYINGKPFQVRRNIWEFLKTVSSQIGSKRDDHSDGSLLNFHDAAKSLWIDALCIDQDKNAERNHQVQQMGKIFSSAQRVIAWIGRRPELASLFHYMRNEMQSQRFFDADYYMALNEFCKNIYWKRAWVRASMHDLLRETPTDTSLSFLQITQEVQLARQVLLLAEADAIDLVTVQAQARDCILRTFGEIIHRDLWEVIDYTATKQEGTILVDNIYQFGDKLCSNPLDLVYSILSISTDGPKVHVDYDISKTQLSRKVLRLLGKELCLWHAARVLMTLLVVEDKNYSPLEPFLEVEAHLLKDVDNLAGRCHTCDMKIGYTSIQKLNETEEKYVHCLACSHTTPKTILHLIVTKTRKRELGAEDLWHMYHDSQTEAHLAGPVDIVTKNSTTQSVTARLPMESIWELVTCTYPHWYLRKGYDGLLRFKPPPSISHESCYGWKLVD